MSYRFPEPTRPSAHSRFGISAQPFSFVGFLSRQKKERKAIGGLKQQEETFILYEAPHRLKETLSALAGIWRITSCRFGKGIDETI